MQVENEYNDKKGEFYILENDKKIAMLEYVFAGPSKFIIDHTEVAVNQEGKGLGKILVNAAVGFAKENNYKVLPLCPYAKSVFDKTPLYNEILF
ncbi:MAG: N-acetyltransferase [Bacteroidia bacterium]|nr:N-acetyltransferase [Bacteroidia bacterium]